MAKCECCGLFGDGKLDDCYDRIRARRAALAGTTWEQLAQQAARAMGIEDLVVRVVPTSLLPATCLDCSSPATIRGRCVYCDRAYAIDNSGHRVQSRDLAAHNIAIRTGPPTACQATEPKPRVTASSRELEKGHPSTWPSQEGEE